MPFDDDLAPIMSTPLLPFELADSHCGPLLLAVAAHSTLPRETSPHQHARGQLLGATRGLLSVDAGNCRWVIPATHAAWIPAHLPHALRSHGPFSGWSLYVAPQACADLPDKPCILGVSALLQAAVARLSAWPATAPEAAQQRLCAVILDELGVAPQVPLGLAMPRDARLLRIALALSAQPGDTRRLSEWAAWAGIAPRSLSRRFVVETGLSFEQWRQRLRLLHALEWLAAGRPVTAIALDLGYDNVSAFIALFRRVFGVTPGRYAPLQTEVQR